MFSLSQKEEHDRITRERLPGITYLDWLKWFHKTLDPLTYVEIGVETGQSLQYVGKYTFSIGIDPVTQIVHGFNSWTKIFKDTSNDFFKKYNLLDELPKLVDLAFIDGLHTYDQTLMDFYNIEYFSTPNTIILLHDVYPVVPETATRDRNTFYWAGDTYKVMTLLAKYRPDLTIFTIPTFPTGLGVITNLDRSSTILHNNFSEIIESIKDDDFSNYIPINLINNNFDDVSRKLLHG